MPEINYLAVIVAAVASFMLGGPWYSPMMFGTLWIRESGVTEQSGHPAKVFGFSFLFALVGATAFAWLLGPAPELSHALQTGAVVGVGFVASSFGINYQFADRSTLMWFIDGGYHVAQFLVFGLILGLWH